MGNCLKTQLKEVVNNDNLKYFGFSKIVAQNAGDCTIRINQGGTIKALNGTFTVKTGTTDIVTNVTEWTNNSYTPSTIHFITNQDNMVLLVDKYNIFALAETGRNFNVSGFDLLYIYDLISVETQDIIDLNEIVHKDSIRILSNSNFTVKNSVSLPVLQQFSCMESSNKFSVEFLNTPNLTQLNVSGSINVYGDLKVWAENIYNSGEGRTSGFCRITYYNNQSQHADIKWDGNDPYVLTGSFAPYVVFTPSGVNIQANEPA